MLRSYPTVYGMPVLSNVEVSDTCTVGQLLDAARFSANIAIGKLRYLQVPFSTQIRPFAYLKGHVLPCGGWYYSHYQQN